MDFKQIEAFRSVMLTRSMTLSAAQLHTSQPNISRLITRLQRELDLKLFARVGLRLVPTPEAEALYVEVERTFVGLHNIRDAATTIKALGTGGLRIGASPALAIGVLPHAIQSFRIAHPDVLIRVHTSDSATVCKWVASGFCDFGLASYVPDLQEVKDRLLYRENGLCIVPEKHRLASKPLIRAKELDDESFISLASGDESRSKVDAAFKPGSRRMNLETPYAATICTMVGMGLGVSVVNPLVVRTLQMPRVKAIRFEPAVEFRVYSVHARQRIEQALCAEFLSCLAQVFERPDSVIAPMA